MAADNTAKTSIEPSNGDHTDLHAQAPGPNGDSGSPDDGLEITEPHDLSFIRARRARANDPRRSLNAAFADRNEAPPTPVALRRAPSAPQPQPPAPRPKPVGRSRTFWIFSAFLFALVAGSTFALFYFRQTWVEGAGVAPEVIRATVPVSSLQMHVEAQGERVLVSWNPHASGVQATSGGLLTIEDAGQHREFPLDASQAANGSVLYRPASGDVTFRLQIRNATGATFNDSLRVLDPAKAALATQVKPAVSPNPPARRLPSSVLRPPSASSRRESARTATLLASNRPNQPDRTNLNPSRDRSLPGADPSSNMPTTPSISASAVPAPSASQSSQPVPQIAQQRTAQQGTGSSTAAPPALAPASTVPAQTTPPATGTVSVVQTRGIAVPDSATNGFVPPQVITQVAPSLRPSLSAAIRSGSRIEVQVLIDSRGRVKHADVIGDLQNVDIGVQKAAINAAKQWKFQPARLNGKRVQSEHTIVFHFQPAGR
jgi:protein TonB